jgi:hypothetical protein
MCGHWVGDLGFSLAAQSGRRDYEKLQTLSAEISWSHNVAILSKCICNKKWNYILDFSSLYSLKIFPIL